MSRVVCVVLLISTAFMAGCRQKLRIETPAGTLIAVESLSLEGVEAIEESRLRSVLVTKESSWLPWRETRYFDREAFEQDLERIERFYRDHGYPKADVTSYDIDLSEAGDSVRLHVTVDEGDPLLVSDVRLENVDVLQPDVIERLQGQLPLKPGQPLVAQHAMSSAEITVSALQDRGYPYATVELDRTESGGAVVVSLRADPGPLSFFGPIEIAGNTSIDDAVIRRQLVYAPGELFDRGRLRESIRRLHALETFESATIEVTGPAGGTKTTGFGNAVPTRITVTEGDHRRFDFSVGFDTEEKAVAEAEWRHVNFQGGARRLGVHAKWSWLDRGVGATFVQPYLFSPDLSLGLHGQAWYADEPVFDAHTRGGRATVMYRRGRRSSVSGALIYQFQSSRIAQEALLDPAFRSGLIALGLNPTTGEQAGALLALGSSLQWFDLDDQLHPRRGSIASLDLEQAGGWLPGSYNYVSARGELRGYYTPVERLTMAGRARYGAIDAFGGRPDVPFAKRFFLGGASSLRGWGRFEVAPLSPAGLPIGGHSLFESSLELRTRVWRSFAVVGFVDGGNVWPDAWSTRFADLLYDAGGGVRFDTPVGLLRLDLGYQLNRLEGRRIDRPPRDRRWRFHFTFGHAF